MLITKMDGCGNEFFLINNLEGIVVNHAELAKEICNRKTGIAKEGFLTGADGLITVEMPIGGNHTHQMRIFNSDGTEAEMCGNGIRCFAKYLSDEELLNNSQIKVETLSGLIVPKIVGYEEETALVEVDMGEPVFDPKKIPINITDTTRAIDFRYELPSGTKMLMTAVSMGNPHAVILYDDVIVDAELLRQAKKYGPIIESDTKIFPKKTNVEFARVNARDDITMKVYERGCGITPACGTGACATLAAAVMLNLTDSKATIHLDGGDLNIEWKGDNHIMMTGPAKTQYKMEYRG